MVRRLGGLCFTLQLALACGGGGDGGVRDAGGADARAPACTTNGDCPGDRVCDGSGRCVPREDVADGGPAGVCGAEGDFDRDGHAAVACGGDDCDDRDPGRFPGNVEVCDAAGHDEDCDPTTLGFDSDRDGYVDDRCCNEQPDGALLCGRDCDDLRDSVGPTAIDGCNGVDDDCDGEVDENPQLVFYVDADGDGFGVSGDPDDAGLDPAVRPVRACAAPDGYSLLDGDCDDGAVQAHPGAVEVCDPAHIDEDCDGFADEYGDGAPTPAVNPTIYYVDADGDGYGSGDRIAIGCSPPRGFSATPGDCRDDRSDVHPGAPLRGYPSCPATFLWADYVEDVEPRYCSGGWQCVTSQGCDSLYGQEGFDPVWDLDCDGVVQAVLVPSCFDDGGGCRPFSSSPPGLARDCGLGAHYLEYECVPEGSGSCLTRGIGEVVGLPCH